ncbi:quinone oxidoreductase family protein [Streptomyces prunicolor]|uniref:quinone oxidoreductase family protein n=1 Tax=Streptomyces prunicolor TaxID=67348 RepID=UPI00039EFAEB|nr:zinc-binding dehydrogenase [Streptomyces prunicolor]
MHAIVMTEFGGPEVLKYTEVPDPQRRGRQLLVDVTLAGVNYADRHVAENSYLKAVDLPYIPGNEVVGVTQDGRRVIGLTQGGGYAEKAIIHPSLAWEIPDGVTDEQAVPLALQGNSAFHILFTVARVEAGEKILVPAAAGGVGSLAVQLAAQNGAQVIALASTEEKRQLALDLGAQAAVDSSTIDGLADRVKEAAGGPVNVALEMTGGQMLQETIATLAPRGRLVLYGFAGGQLEDIPVRTLLQNSITASGFWLPSLYTDRRVSLELSTMQLFASVVNGALKTVSGGSFPLEQAADAHRLLASRSATGKISLVTGK